MIRRAAYLLVSRPLHGSQLYHALGLLPEFGGSLPTSSSINEITEEIVDQ